MDTSLDCPDDNLVALLGRLDSLDNGMFEKLVEHPLERYRRDKMWGSKVAVQVCQSRLRWLGPAFFKNIFTHQLARPREGHWCSKVLSTPAVT